MIEKVNPMHPDKIADRIAGAIVDMAYGLEDSPRVAVEVLIGHGKALIIIETNTNLDEEEIKKAVARISKEEIHTKILVTKQDEELSKNQTGKIRCGDNGIFKGTPTTDEEKRISKEARAIYKEFGTDGKYILADDRLIVCQSHARSYEIKGYEEVVFNPLGYWTGGLDVDTGATNRKLGSDMGDAVTGGGLHGKDLSKADVSVNIYAHVKAQETGEAVELHCAIGDEEIDGRPYEEIVEVAREYIKEKGGFEKLAEWGLF